MISDIKHLHEIALKESRIVLGLMSGTSLDGLDLALCHIKGSGTETELSLIHYTTIPYTEDIIAYISKVFAKKEVDFTFLTALNAKLADIHSEMILKSLNKWETEPSKVDLIASHGQTVMHAPAHQHKLESFPDSTFQIGDGDRIAVNTGIITISDFRQKHLAAGGEGAPLSAYGDFFLFSSNEESRLLLNIGGIANFTYLPSGQHFDDVFVTDTGPGNTLMDSYLRYYLDIPFDADGVLASKGNIHSGLLKILKSHEFFDLPFPKTTGPESFNLRYLQNAIEISGTQGLPHPDVIATLNRFTAETIAEAIKKNTQNVPCAIYLSGGGMKNTVLIHHLKALLPGYTISPAEDIGIPGDAKEAVLFAVLANECIAGSPDYGQGKKGFPLVSMGKISLPV